MSRFDGIGMFWEDFPQEKVRGERNVVNRPPPPVPDTKWVTPTTMPDLSAAKIIGLDTETKDPNLLSKGPGAIRGDGHIVGISVAVDDKTGWYFPMRHEFQPEDNLDPEMVLAWARRNLTRPNQLKVGANLMYDLEFLAMEGVKVAGPFWDVQVADPLINENLRSYSLDNIAKRRLGMHKVDDELYDWSYRAYGGAEGRRQAGNIYRCPPKLVGPYAEADAWLPFKIMLEQQKLLAAEDLTELADLEMRLIPMLHAMRLNGVRVNVDGAAKLNDQLEIKENELQGQLNKLAGFEVFANNKGSTVQRLFDDLGLEYPKTAAGNASFTAPFLKGHAHPAAELVTGIRTCQKNRSTFLEGAILGNEVNGRIHTQFHQMKGDSNGTVSGRFSSSAPNLQNIPSRDEILAPLVRGLFIPEEGCAWRRFDWSQIEYRMLVHYAIGDSGNVARAMYRDQPDTDFHAFTQALVLELTGKDLGRKPTKGINFGLVYGMGIPTLARQLGMPVGFVKDLFESYHQAVPFVKETFNKAQGLASRRGYVKTLLNRRARFESYEFGKFIYPDKKLQYIKDNGLDANYFDVVYDKEEAITKWNGKIQRAFTHAALNRVLQGSSADGMKKAMVDIWEAGLCADTGVPLLTVHDELDYNDPMTAASDKAFIEVKHVMETCLPQVNVPLVADEEKGPDWGHLT